MKSIKKRWHGIPIAILLAVLVVALAAGGVLAITTPQTQIITQVIWEPVTPVASSVSGFDNVTKPDLLVGTMDTTENMVVIATVTVVVGTGDAPSTLTLALDTSTTTLYDTSLGGYGVILASLAVDNPMDEDIVFSLNSIYGPTTSSETLAVEGTYTFTEIAGGTAGPDPGTANVEVTIDLVSP